MAPRVLRDCCARPNLRYGARPKSKHHLRSEERPLREALTDELLRQVQHDGDTPLRCHVARPGAAACSEDWKVHQKMSAKFVRAKACFSPDYKSDDGGNFDQSKVSNYFVWDTKKTYRHIFVGQRKYSLPRC
jgi:hypothetical protein